MVKKKNTKYVASIKDSTLKKFKPLRDIKINPLDHTPEEFAKKIEEDLDKKFERLNFRYAVVDPLEHVVWSKSVVIDYERLLRVWSRMFIEMRFYQKVSKEIPEQKILTNLHKDLERLTAKIEKLKLAEDLEELMNELSMSRYHIRRWLGAKQEDKKSSSKYPRGLVLVTRALMKFWQTAVKSKKKINAYNPGDAHELKEELAKPSKNPKLKNIDPKHNPAGAFIQRVLALYFDKKLNNSQVQTLLDKCYSKVFLKSPSLVAKPKNYMYPK